MHQSWQRHTGRNEKTAQRDNQACWAVLKFLGTTACQSSKQAGCLCHDFVALALLTGLHGLCLGIALELLGLGIPIKLTTETNRNVG